MSAPAKKCDDVDPTLPLDALVRSIGVQRGKPLAFFLGAGSSVSSGVPSAQRCIWEWKREIFLTNNPRLEDQFSELSLVGVQRRIQSWLNSQGGYPAEGSAEEYGFYIGRCFPIADDRRSFFAEKIRAASPHAGYQLLCHLALAGLLRSVWSTNFDGLVARAAAQYSLTPIEVGTDCQHRAVRQVSSGELLCVSIHGDYRYDALKNTPEELQSQEKGLCDALAAELATTSILVCGYSGRDESVMRALKDGYRQAGPGVLYWCGYGASNPPEPVAELIAHARANGRQAYYTPGQGFDDLAIRLSSHCLDGESRHNAQALISGFATKDLGGRKPFEIASPKSSTLIKSNAFEISCPSEVFSFDLKQWPKDAVWKALRDLTVGKPIVAVPHGGKVLAVGLLDDVKDVFAGNIKATVERTPIGPDDLQFEEGHIVSLLRNTLVQVLGIRTGLANDGRHEIWLDEALETQLHKEISYSAHESVRLFLRQIGRIQYLVLLPSIKVLGPDGNAAPREIAVPFKLGILGYQHNDKFNAAINSWRERLLGKKGKITLEFPADAASTFSFGIRCAPAFAEVGSDQPSGRSSHLGQASHLLKHTGITLAEPRLLFGSRREHATQADIHPIRGLVKNRPYDFPLTQRGLAQSIRLGVVSAGQDVTALSKYLQGSRSTFRPSKSEGDYLLDYPGFHEAYGLPLDIPDPDGPGWVICPEPSDHDPKTGTVEIARQITRSIDALQASYLPNVVLIYFPQRWDHLRGFRNENERFDVHDFVKAFCVQRGIATQFLNQDTIEGGYQCRVWWWLSLALYVKAMRTPFVLEHLADDTAFVGLGFSIDHAADIGQHVLMGCSHIYSTRGEGLQYRLSQVEEPIRRGRNVFMSREDARRIGEQIRELFFEARSCLPQRVVLHKRTPFLKDEREGLLEGLGGVDGVDMIEIQIDRALRYIASKANSKDADGFPVRRGTVLKLDDYTALLWAHGSAVALNPRLKYYQGKRRIPAPLTLRRHAGDSDLRKICMEILGLSKMNWNNFDLYSKMPATLDSSGEIARIGNLLEGFGSASYDYRLFM